MKKRPFIGVLFRCCRVYGRAYLNRDQSAFVANCPKCAQPMKVGVSPTGGKGRFFSVG